MRCKLCFLLFSLTVPGFGGYLQLNGTALDTSRFNVTPFSVTLPGPLGMVQLSDGSFAVAAYYPGIVRLTDADHNGVADNIGTRLFAAPGAHTGLVQAGNYYIDGNFGDYQNGHFDGQVMTVLKPGANPSDQWTPVGALKLDFPAGWEHSQLGIATRPTPGHAGSYDLVFNIGSEFDRQASTDKVALTGGLISGTLDGDSLYAVTLDLSGQTPVASDLRKVASGIRNVIGMGFQPGTGDFYFGDNAIDGTGPLGDEPPQAEEINRITAADFNSRVVPNFGYPDCYTQYRTGAAIGSGCVNPFFAIQPIANGTPLGSESEGITQIAFAPSGFPSGFNNGIFIGFSGKGSTGAADEENAVGYYDFGTGNYLHFSENSEDGVYQPIGIMATANALFIADYGAGIVYEVTAAAVPEPSSFGTAFFSLLAALVIFRRRA